MLSDATCYALSLCDVSISVNKSSPNIPTCSEVHVDLGIGVIEHGQSLPTNSLKDRQGAVRDSRVIIAAVSESTVWSRGVH